MESLFMALSTEQLTTNDSKVHLDVKEISMLTLDVRSRQMFSNIIIIGRLYKTIYHQQA